jgi:hypothetical protein
MTVFLAIRDFLSTMKTEPSMRPLQDLGFGQARGVEVLLTDIDDTVSTGGRLEAEAYTAIERLMRAGIKVIPVTGRPAGWCDMIARFWPVEAVVGENGAFYFRYLHGERRMLRHFAQSESLRTANRLRLDRIAEEVQAAVPGAHIAADQPYRIADLAIDFAEDVEPLPRDSIDRIVAIFLAHGAAAKISSIHVNGWFGDHDKLAMSARLLKAEFGLDLAVDADRIMFVGDSPNDEPMFAAVKLSVGVGNVVRFRSRFKTLPTYVTSGWSGAGFVELASHLISAKRS